MTFADMVLAHALLQRLGQGHIDLVLDLLEGDARPDPIAVPILIELVRMLEYEFGGDAPVVRELMTALKALCVRLPAAIPA